MVTSKIFYPLLFAIVIYGCGDNRRESSVKRIINPYTGINIRIDSLGRPQSERDFYIPLNTFGDSEYLLANFKRRIKEGKSSDTDLVKWEKWWMFCDTNSAWNVSRQLYWFEEPILSNKYSGHDTYRLFTNPSFSNMSIIRITNYIDSLEIIYKELGTLKEPTNRYEEYKHKIVQRKRIVLSPMYWDTLNNYVGRSLFWTFQEPSIEDGVLDGVEYIFEGHKKESYKSIKRTNMYSNSLTDLFNYIRKLVLLRAG